MVTYMGKKGGMANGPTRATEWGYIYITPSDILEEYFLVTLTLKASTALEGDRGLCFQ